MDLQQRGMPDERNEANTQDLADPEITEEQVNVDELDRKEASTANVLEIAAIYASLAIFAIFGTLARIGLSGLSSYPGQSVFSTAAPQAVGCALMGLIARNRVAFEHMYVAIRRMRMRLTAAKIWPTLRWSGYWSVWLDYYLLDLDV